MLNLHWLHRQASQHFHLYTKMLAKLSNQETMHNLNYLCISETIVFFDSFAGIFFKGKQAFKMLNYDKFIILIKLN